MDQDLEQYLTVETDQAIEKAESEGFEVVKGDSTHLLLDLDTVAQKDQYTALFSMFDQKYGGACEEARWLSKSGNLHVVVKTTQEFEPMARLVLQAVLGSDPKREMLGVRRVQAGIEHFSLLFKPRP